MPKITLTMSEDQMLMVLNRNLRIPGRVESIVHDESVTAFVVPDSYSLLIDLEPVHDYATAFTFAQFARIVFGPKHDISEVEDPEDYAVLENMLAATSQFDMYSFDWVND